MLNSNWHRHALHIGCLLGAIFLLSAAPVRAQTADTPADTSATPEVRLGIVDWEYILRESSVGKAVQQQLKQKRDQYRNDQQSRIEGLRTEHEALMKQRTLMAQEAFQQKLQALEQKRQALQAESEKRGKQIYQAQQNALTEIQNTLAEICKGYMNRNDLTVVLTKTQTVLFLPEYDFTEAALSELNQKLPSMTVTFPALQ